MGFEVVDGTLDGLAGGEAADVLDDEFGLEGVGVVEVAFVAGVEGELGEVAVVEVEGEEGGVELGGKLGGEGGFAGAGAAADAEDEGWGGKVSWVEPDFPWLAGHFRGEAWEMAVRRAVKRASTWRPMSMTSSWWMDLVGDAGGGVGDEREAEDLEAHVAGDDDLVDGGHADEGGAEGAEGADLGGGLVGGAEDGEVDALGEREALRGRPRRGECCGGLGSRRWSCRRSGGRRWEAPGTGEHGEAGVVGAEGGVGAGEVDVVGDGDEGAGGVGGVDAAGGVGDDEGGAAEEAEDAGGEGDLGHGVALVGVDAALHDGDGDAGDGAEDEVAGVAFDGGLREVGDVGVGDGDGSANVRGEGAEAGAEDDAYGSEGGRGRGCRRRRIVHGRRGRDWLIAGVLLGPEL